MGPARPSGPARPQRGRPPRRPLRTTLTLLLLAIAVIAGGIVLYPAWHHADTRAHAGAHAHAQPAHRTPPPPLTIRYKAGADASAAVARPWFEVVNTSRQSVRLQDVSLRYYFTEDGAPSYGFNCVQASVGCSHVTGRIVALPGATATADHYLEIGFAAGTASLAPGAKSGALGLQLYRPDGRGPDQRDDRSFDAAATTFRASTRVTGYLRGRRVWGDEPSGAPAAPPPGTRAQGPRPAPPREIVFDDFHYSGPDDPALHAHGWLVRTSPGGPGILDTWSTEGVSFPARKSARGGQVLQLRAGTDGTKGGTRQSEVQSSGTPFLDGTYAARIHFTDTPVSGRNGDSVNESFYMISPDQDRYSELDNEYQPNGGWGAPGPRFGTTSWHSAVDGDRVTRQTMRSLSGWHTLVVTAVHGVATYSVDGVRLFSSDGRYFPRENMSVNFNTWFVDLPFRGERAWDMQVNWFYYNATAAQSLAQVDKAVDALYGSGTDYVNTVSAS